MTIGDRVEYAIQKSGKSKSQISREIGISPSSLGDIIKGRTNQPAEQTIRNLCKVLRIKRDWLILGDGEMEEDINREDEISQFFGKVLADKSDSFRFTFVSALSRLTEEDWDTLAEIMQRIIDRR